MPLLSKVLYSENRIDVSHDVMETSEDSENEISSALQARPPANTTRGNAHAPAVPAAPAAPPAPTASAPTAPAPNAPTPIAHIARTAPVAPAAPGAASSSNPVHPSSFNPIHRLKLSLPRMRRADERFLLPESRYNMIVNATIYTSLKAFLVSVGETEDATFPWRRVIQDFVHLYFEHFDHEYPVVHPYALEFGLDKTSISWMVLLAVVTVGSQYSAFSNASMFSAAFGEILSHAITQNRPQAPEATTLSYAQSVFLSDVCLMFDGSHKAQLKLQYERNVLVTLARVLKVDPCMNTKASQAPRHWKAWLARESRIRLLHSIFQLECLQLILFDRQPIFGQHELPDEFPCRQSLWCRRNADNFVLVYQSDQDLPQSASTQLDVRKASESMAGMDAYRRNLYMLSLYSEERLFLDKMSYSSIWKSSLSSQVTGVSGQEQWAHLTSTHSALRSVMFQSMDEVFAAIPVSAKPDYIAARDVIHHVLSLLRLVSLHMLESFSGWQGDDSAADMSANNLKHWMENDAPSARKCLWHAVCVYSTLKAKQKFACHDPLFFLISFFYIWAFDTLVVAPDLEKPQTSTNEVRLLDTREIQMWIAEGPNTRLNLVGVGNLTGKASSLRLVTEVCQIFSKRKSWAGLCRGLASAVDRILRRQAVPQGAPQGDPRGDPQGVSQGASDGEMA
ncbi:transcriptional regulator family: C2H2 zinc finger and Fungal Specific TF [Penicillium robsamsonii]|uniref:transcriptional regulator family: C2H2 zinc finger and Fungal Specific TF n=1 Tax=Penicillium robsamsonii TaxID=1792511 RepID=UPI00254874E9|nr:transcriptional regulator family: C2H2 zinc finger and Fungal Specific TF [Penicillium robsamsonii]KAJ5836490.1 transcriptional regulator family: C2H2 zinc finger and Fungal Specific TF [Penicillium robsamsonii]